MMGHICALIALGFHTVFNATEAINFAPGEFVMLGGMTAVAFTRAGPPLVLARTGAVVSLTLVGLALERRAQDRLAEEAVRRAYLG
jgi:branched-chain amino acid transport system permease protein